MGLVVIFWVLAVFSDALMATPDSSPSWGIAMHGDLKYPSDFRHFDGMNPDAPKGGIIHIPVQGTFDSLNPFVIQGSAPAGLSLYSEKLVFQTLMKRSPNEPFSLYGLIAEKIETPVDRSFVIFYLNPRAAWSDGRPITADDVIFTFHLLKEKGHPGARQFYKTIQKIAKIGDDAVRFDFRKNDDGAYNRESPLLMAMMYVLPKHALENKDFNQVSFDKIPVSGPYTIGKIDFGKSITYRRRPNYWGRDLPAERGYYNFDTCVMDYYRDRGIAEQAFKAGLADVWLEDDTRRFGQLTHKPKSGMEFMTLKGSGPVGMTAFAFNLRRPMFQDIRVRQALNLAFDFESKKHRFLTDDFQRTTSFFDNTVFKIPQKPTDDPCAMMKIDRREALIQAKKLLRDAGWVIQGGRLVHGITGAPFVVEVLVYESRHQKWILSFADDLKPLGIQVHCRLVDSAQYMDRLNSFDFDMIVHFWGHSLSPGNDQLRHWGGAAANIKGGGNYIGIQNPTIDALCVDIMGAVSRSDLIAAVGRLDQMLLSGYYVIPLFHNPKKYLAYWTKFGHPDIKRLGYVEMTSWWAIP